MLIKLIASKILFHPIYKFIPNKDSQDQIETKFSVFCSTCVKVAVTYP